MSTSPLSYLLQFSSSIMSDSLWSQQQELDFSRPDFPVFHYLPVSSNSHLLSRWCHSTTSSSVAPFSSCPQSFPALGSFPVSWLFALGDQTIGDLASASVLPVNIQDWFPLGLTGLISLLSKGLSRVFSSTTIQTHQFFSTRLLYGPTLTSVCE